MKDSIAIVTPTLDWTRGAGTLNQAIETTGEMPVPISGVLVWDLQPRGSTLTANATLEAGRSLDTKYVSYLNDDVKTPEGWLLRLYGVMEGDPKFGIVASSGACGVAPQLYSKPGMEPGVEEVKQLSLFCTLIRVEMLDQIGLFDAKFIHWGNDDDLCLRARKAGWKLGWVQDVWVEHQRKGGTTTPELRALSDKWAEHDRAYLREKWRDKR